MPQNALHGLVGLAVCRRMGRNAAQAQPWVMGVILGLMLPDADLYPAGILRLAGVIDGFDVIHRTATHSLFLVVLLMILGGVFRSKPVWSAACMGLSLGVGLHIFLDVFMWFSALPLLWPLNVLGEGDLGVVDVWKGVEIPEMAKSFRDVLEMLFAAIYLTSLAKIGREDPGTSSARKLKGCVYVCWGLLAVTSVVAFFVPYDGKMVFVTGVLLLVFVLPVLWWQTWRLRAPITAWCLR